MGQRLRNFAARDDCSRKIRAFSCVAALLVPSNPPPPDHHAMQLDHRNPTPPSLPTIPTQCTGQRRSALPHPPKMRGIFSSSSSSSSTAAVAGLLLLSLLQAVELTHAFVGKVPLGVGSIGSSLSSSSTGRRQDAWRKAPLSAAAAAATSARETSTTPLPSTSTTTAAATTSSSSITLPLSTLGDDLKTDFPALHHDAYPGKPLVYLDSAATSQKPKQVLDAMSDFYEHSNANVHRGAHALSIRATEAYEAARDKVQNFIHASAREEIIFTRGATEAINLVANTWGIQNLKAGDEILLTVMEHHSNLVPWQLVAKKTGAVLKFVGLNEEEGLDMPQFHSLLSSKTKLVAFPHVSNTLGCILPVSEMAAAAHAVGAVVLVDACQSIPHMRVDVQELDVDFLAASSHKMCGPTGAGFLYGKLALLKQMPPWHGGGEMIDEVFFEYSTYAEPPARFEAGTPPIAEVVGMGAACDYLMGVGMEKVEEHEHQLGKYLYERLSEVEGVRIYGPPPGKEGKGRAALAAFNTEQVHASDLAFFLDHEGVAIRSGHHCTQPLHRMLHAKGSLRASLYVYNTKGDVDVFIAKLKETMEFFGNFQSGGAGAGAGASVI